MYLDQEKDSYDTSHSDELFQNDRQSVQETDDELEVGSGDSTPDSYRKTQSKL